MSGPKDFKIAIVGGGMCGLACAIGLQNLGIQADVFEAAPKFEEVGAGVGIGPNAIRALEGLGLMDAVLLKADQPKPAQRPFRFVTGTGKHEHILDYPVSNDDLGLGIYRPAFLEALLPLVNSQHTHFNKRCKAVLDLPDGGHVLEFEDGTTHEADLIIGADGIKSITRNYVVGNTEQKQLIFTNTVAYRGLVPSETLKTAGVKTDFTTKPLCWVGKDKHIITFVVKGTRVLNIVAFTTDRTVPIGSIERVGPWVEDVPEEDLLAAFSGWGEDAMLLLNHIKKPSKWYIHALKPQLQTYVKQNVVLVGDAAHAMPPHLGAGVGQGFEDVYALCRILGSPKTSKATLKDALHIYDTMRAPRANMVSERSMRMGEIYEKYGDEDHDYDSSEMRKHLSGMWEPVWHHDLEKEVDLAIENWTESKFVEPSIN